MQRESSIIHVEIVQHMGAKGEVEHRLTLTDFRDQLVKEIGSVTWTMTRKQFERKVAAAVDRVIQKVRDSKRGVK